jgi:hypothetical protein
VRPHDLRHGAATLAFTAGVELKVVQTTLGHFAVGMTPNTYSSVLPQLTQAAAKAAAAVIPRGSHQASGCAHRWPTGNVVACGGVPVDFFIRLSRTVKGVARVSHESGIELDVGMLHNASPRSSKGAR